MLVAVSAGLCDISVQVIIMNLSFLEKIPEEFHCVYKGSQEEVACVPEDFCTDPNLVSFQPDMTLDETFYNWVQKMDLTCAPNSKLAMLGSSYFMGWILTLAVLPRLSDIYGRRKIIVYGNVVQATAFLTVLTT